MQITKGAVRREEDVMEENKTTTYTFTRNQFIGLLLGAVVTAFVGGAVSAIRTLNNDHFTIVSLDGRVIALEENFVPRGEITIELREIKADVLEIKEILKSKN